MKTIPDFLDEVKPKARRAWDTVVQCAFDLSAMLFVCLLTTRFWVGAFFGLMIGFLIGG